MTANSKIQCGWITGLVLALLNLFAAIMGHSVYGTTFDLPRGTNVLDHMLRQGLWMLIDVAFISVCTIALALKSRVGAVALLAFHLLNSILILAVGFEMSAIRWLFRIALFVPLWLGVSGTFELHRATQLRVASPD